MPVTRSSSKERSSPRSPQSPKQRSKTESKEDSTKVSKPVLRDRNKLASKEKMLPMAGQSLFEFRTRKLSSENYSRNKEMVMINHKMSEKSTKSDRSKKASGPILSTYYQYGGPVGSHMLFIIMAVSVFLTYHLVCYPSQSRKYAYWYNVSIHVLNWDCWISLFYWRVWISYFVILKALHTILFVVETIVDSYFKSAEPYSLFVSLKIFFVGMLLVQYYFKNIFDDVAKHWPACLAACATISLLSSLILFIKSYITKATVSVYAKSRCHPYNFLVGRELHPVMNLPFNVKVDVKKYLTLSRLGIWMAFSLIWAFQSNLHSERSVQLLVAIQLLWVFSKGFHQMAAYHDPVLQDANVGLIYIFSQLTLAPVFLTLPLCAYVHNRPVLSDYYAGCYFNAASILLAILGFIIFNYHTNIRTTGFYDPYNKKILSRQVIVASGGARIVVDGWFKWIRHPDIVGEVLFVLAVSLILGPHWVILVQLLICVWRAHRTDRLYLIKYGRSWSDYCRKHSLGVLMPSVFWGSKCDVLATIFVWSLVSYLLR